MTPESNAGGPELPAEVPPEEFERRISAVRNELGESDADAAVWFDALSIEYLTGFSHIQTERPVLLAVTDDRIAITVPRLEVERAEPHERIDSVSHYFDYPGGEPVKTAAGMLSDMGIETVLADMDGAPGTMGYSGPPLSEFVDVEKQNWVDRMRTLKSSSEVDLIRHSAYWADRAHEHLADLAEPGAHPVTVSQEASTAGSREMLEELGDRYTPRTRGEGPVSAGFISGRQTALPHGNSVNRKLEEGDVIITGASANVDGYFSELERTMFIGEPSEEQRHYFELMLEAQQIAMDSLETGVPLGRVDQAVFDFFEEQGVEDLARHHTGHSIGLDVHEPPFIDRGEDVEIQAGHVYTIEPGLYTDREGYRHSDTLVVTDSGVERLTEFPRDLESNVIR